MAGDPAGDEPGDDGHEDGGREEGPPEEVDVDDEQSENNDPTMQIIVNISFREKSITLEVSPDDTIGSIKSQIQGAEQIPRKHQRLLFADLQLQNDDTVGECGIEDGSSLNLLLSLCGGGKRSFDELVVTKERQIQTLKGDIESLAGDSSGDLRAEIIRLVNFGNWNDALTDKTTDEIKSLLLVLKSIRGMNSRRVAEALIPFLSPMYRDVRETLEKIMKAKEALVLTSQLLLGQLIMDEAGNHNFKSFLTDLEMLLMFKAGRESSSDHAGLLPALDHLEI